MGGEGGGGEGQEERGGGEEERRAFYLMDTNSKSKQRSPTLTNTETQKLHSAFYFASKIVYRKPASPRLPKPMARSKHECLLRFSAVVLTRRRFLQSLASFCRDYGLYHLPLPFPLAPFLPRLRTLDLPLPFTSFASALACLSCELMLGVAVPIHTAV